MPPEFLSQGLIVVDQGAVDGLDNWNKQKIITRIMDEERFYILFQNKTIDRLELTEDLLDDGGHEEGDGDHGGGQEQEDQRGAGHHQVGGAVRRPLQ